MASWDPAVAQEIAIVQTKPVACIISVIGILVGERLCVRNIGIANFTWCEQYEHLGLSEAIIARFREVYAKLDILIEYDLILPTYDLDVLKKQIGFIARKFNPGRIAAIKKQYGACIFITCGTISEALLSKWNLVLMGREGVL